MLYYGNDISTMWEAKRKREQSENEEAEGESKPSPPKHKMPAKRDLYTIYRQAGKTHSKLLTALDFRQIFSKRRYFKISYVIQKNLYFCSSHHLHVSSLSQVKMNSTILFACSQCMGLHSSNGRALQCQSRGHELESH